MAGKVGRSGRKKIASTLVNEALERVDEHIPELFDKLIEKGLQGDRECLIYLIDRRLGKPKASTEIDLQGGEQLGEALLIQLFTRMEQRHKELDNPEYPQLPEASN